VLSGLSTLSLQACWADAVDDKLYGAPQKWSMIGHTKDSTFVAVSGKVCATLSQDQMGILIVSSY
jgi:hypothetical protein